MAYTIKKISRHTGISLADDRFGAFETIRDHNDPDMQDRRACSKPLSHDDYFTTLPQESNQLLHQKRLHAMVEKRKLQQAADQKSAEQERKEAVKFSF